MQHVYGFVATSPPQAVQGHWQRGSPGAACRAGVFDGVLAQALKEGRWVADDTGVQETPDATAPARAALAGVCEHVPAVPGSGLELAVSTQPAPQTLPTEAPAVPAGQVSQAARPAGPESRRTLTAGAFQSGALANDSAGYAAGMGWQPEGQDNGMPVVTLQGANPAPEGVAQGAPQRHPEPAHTARLLPELPGATTTDSFPEQVIRNAADRVVTGTQPSRPENTGAQRSGVTMADLTSLVAAGEGLRPSPQPAALQGRPGHTHAVSSAPSAPEPATAPAGGELTTFQLPEAVLPDEGRLRMPVTDLPREADQPAASPRGPEDPHQVVRQLTRFMKVMLDGTRSEVRLRLHPEHLGTVAVRLILNEGVVRAHLVVRDPSVRTVLESNLDHLRTRFAEQGLRVEQVTVTDGGEGTYGQPHHPQHGAQRNPWTQDGRQVPAHRRPDQAPQEDLRHQPHDSHWRPHGTGTRLDHLA